MKTRVALVFVGLMITGCGRSDGSSSPGLVLDGGVSLDGGASPDAGPPDSGYWANCTPLRVNPRCGVALPACSGPEEMAVTVECFANADAGSNNSAPGSGEYCYAISQACRQDAGCLRSFFTERDGGACGACLGYAYRGFAFSGRCTPP